LRGLDACWQAASSARPPTSPSYVTQCGPCPAQAELEALPGYGSKSASKLLAAIQGSRDRPAAVVLEALGVPGVGKAVARQLLQQLGSVAAALRASGEELQMVRGCCGLSVWACSAACMRTNTFGCSMYA
jgi:excinuclease UvrABC nuclease subunit